MKLTKKIKTFPEHYYESYSVPKEKDFKEFEYECEALVTGRITKSTVWCKNITAFRKLLKVWSREQNFKYYQIKEG